MPQSPERKAEYGKLHPKPPRATLPPEKVAHVRAIDKNWAAQNRDRLRPYKSQKERVRGMRKRRDPAEWGDLRVLGIKKRCQETGLPFNLDAADLLVPAVCPALGTPFVFGHLSHPHSPTVDRLVPSLGYVKGNVTVISRRANQIKSDALNGADLRKVADWLDGKLAAV